MQSEAGEGRGGERLPQKTLHGVTTCIQRWAKREVRGLVKIAPAVFQAGRNKFHVSTFGQSP